MKTVNIKLRFLLTDEVDKDSVKEKLEDWVSERVDQSTHLEEYDELEIRVGEFVSQPEVIVLKN